MADDAEERSVELSRAVGELSLRSWAETRAAEVSTQVERSMRSAKKNVKKKSVGGQPLGS